MISKEIQKHQELQEKYLELATKPEYNERCLDHKECLIIMRDYAQGVYDKIEKTIEYIGFVQNSKDPKLWSLRNQYLLSEYTKARVYVDELNKMIKKYE